MPLGFSDKIRFHVEQNICREDEGGPQPDCFDKPSKIVYNFLNKVLHSVFAQKDLIKIGNCVKCSFSIICRRSYHRNCIINTYQS